MHPAAHSNSARFNARSIPRATAHSSPHSAEPSHHRRSRHAHPATPAHHPSTAHAKHAAAAHGGASLNRTALVATLHCLAGCAIGEITGMVVGTALGWSNAQTILLALALAYLSGFALTLSPLLRRGYGMRSAVRIALAADTASITIMEIIDNLLMLAMPGAMDAPLDSLYFWMSLGLSLALAGAAAWPLNRWLIARGRGHALTHAHH